MQITNLHYFVLRLWQYVSIFPQSLFRVLQKNYFSRYAVSNIVICSLFWVRVNLPQIVFFWGRSAGWYSYFLLDIFMMDGKEVRTTTKKYKTQMGKIIQVNNNKNNNNNNTPNNEIRMVCVCVLCFG